VQEGGFAMITGESGTGKSVALRIVASRLQAMRDVVVGVIERPQSKSSDFYRELGDIFRGQTSMNSPRSSPRVLFFLGRRCAWIGAESLRLAGHRWVPWLAVHGETGNPAIRVPLQLACWRLPIIPPGPVRVS